jgi:N-acetylneuraminic acid mutarotase
VTLSPETATVHVNKSLQFTATVQNSSNRAVVWSLSGDGCSGAACGTVSNTGLYTAPASPPEPPFVTVKATSVADSTKSATATVTLFGPVVVTVRPADVLVTVGRSRWFGAQVDNAIDSRVTWTLSGSMGSGVEYGTITSDGLYTAPAAVPADPIVTITATSVEDASVSGSTTATIRPAGTSEIIWTWVSGSDTAKQLGVYGTKGVPSPSNVPGSRVAAVSWIDTGGNLWLFGGYGLGPSQSGLIFNDLWKFDQTANEWTWMSGSNTGAQPGVYGTKGVADPLNVPGSRENPLAWSDSRGKLWLFGGMGYDSLGQDGSLNDLWSFDPATTQWTYVSGFYLTNEWGRYGTKGVPAPSNVPGARYRGASWIDAAGKLWLFGGWGHSRTGAFDFLNDLWMFDLETSEWTWVSGSDEVHEYGEYGTKGVPSPANVPGSRCDLVTWIDLDGRLWLFGGYLWEDGECYFNDLWRFDPATLEWTWMSGSDWINEPGYYGVQGTADPRNAPGSRSGAVSWTDQSGVLWLFGGFGFDSDGNAGWLNDLWRFDPTTAEWTWVAGSDLVGEPGNYGTRNVPDISNVPGGREFALSWLDADGRFWLWGGYGFDSLKADGWLNDLWYFTRPIPAPKKEQTGSARRQSSASPIRGQK